MKLVLKGDTRNAILMWGAVASGGGSCCCYCSLQIDDERASSMRARGGGARVVGWDLVRLGLRCFEKSLGGRG